MVDASIIQKNKSPELFLAMKSPSVFSYNTYTNIKKEDEAMTCVFKEKMLHKYGWEDCSNNALKCLSEGWVPVTWKMAQRLKRRRVYVPLERHHVLDGVWKMVYFTPGNS